MTEAIIGDALLIYDGRVLTVSHRSGNGLSLKLDSTCVDELVDFLSSLSSAESNQRRFFRTPLWHTCGIAVTIRHDDQEYPVVAKNISLSGIFVEAPCDGNLNLTSDETVQVHIEFENTAYTCRGLVRYASPQGCGLFFPDSIRNGQIVAPPVYSQMVMELQRRWLARGPSQATETADDDPAHDADAV